MLDFLMSDKNMDQFGYLEGNTDKVPPILIVDDDPLNLEILIGMVTHIKDLKCDTANNGVTALNLVKSRLKEVEAGRALMYKVILMDYSMPEMDGP